MQTFEASSLEQLLSIKLTVSSIQRLGALSIPHDQAVRLSHHMFRLGDAHNVYK